MLSNHRQLTSFENDLRNLKDAKWMFSGCSSLTTFASDLSSLEESGNLMCNHMFEDCTSLQSVKIKCSASNKYLMTKTYLNIRPEATLEVSTDNGATWETVNN